MPDTIRDGTGAGFLAKVNSQNYLKVSGYQQQLGPHTALIHNEYYTTVISAQATASADCIGYIKNTKDTDMLIDFTSVHSTAETQIHVQVGGIGTPVGGTDVVPTNSTAGSNNTALGTFQSGADITGITDGKIVQVTTVPANTTAFNSPVPIVIPTNQILTFWAYQNTATIYIGVGFYYHPTL
jgi:hypothetical protein